MANTTLKAATAFTVALAFAGQAQAQLPILGGILGGGGLPGLDALPLDSLSGAGGGLSTLFNAAGAFSGPLEAIPFATLLNAASPFIGIAVSDLPLGDLAATGLPLLSPLTINALEAPLAIDTVVGGILGLQ